MADHPWDYDDQAFSHSQQILQEVLDRLIAEEHVRYLPQTLYHYTSLETAERILQKDDIRLGHAEYSNDQQELEEARRAIRARVAVHGGNALFLTQVQTNYDRRAADLDAYIFCMSTGDQNRQPNPQDMLSQWRAYGADGRGACIELKAADFGRLAKILPGLRINPVIYDPTVQSLLIDDILTRGDGLSAHSPTAVEATVAALVFVTPLMKAEGFSEEREWRLIFMPPPPPSPQPEYGFHPRRDFLAPYVTLNDLWTRLPKRSIVPGHDPVVQQLIPATGIMIGPSGHQPLNVRAIAKVLAQARRAIQPTRSAIPYRSLS